MLFITPQGVVNTIIIHFNTNVVIKQHCLTTEAAGQSQTGGKPALVSTGAACIKMKDHYNLLGLVLLDLSSYS